MINKDGEQLGIMRLEEALALARKQNLDLVQVTDKVSPPVCKIIEYGKYLYHQQKKEKKQSKKTSEIKGIRLRFNISDHDIETRVKQAEQFLAKGDKVKIEMVLRGREKALAQHAKEKIEKFLEDLNKIIEVDIERGPIKNPRGLIIIIKRKK